MTFGLERTTNSRFGVRIVRKTKVKKLQCVNEEEFYGVVSSHAEVSDKVDQGETSAKRGTKKRLRKMFNRNKIAPAPQEQGWKITGEKTPPAANYYREKDSNTSTTMLVEEDLEDGTLSSYGTTPLRMDSYNVVGSSTGSSSDPSVYDEEDMPAPSNVYVANRVTLNLTDHAWEDTGKHTESIG
ncbi:hypothetical protein OS493_022959 [Desmophyllum pertusum]|uniref:Uncharacterized protein n=1 Tax=Desmophyllum pertusum TaxID=174260 RepID=A0A9W9ZBI0_9CNID|nr:hypothetical protein OS493_022959 [Desmophyllum pertusum]